MNSVVTANLENVEAIIKLDCDILGNTSRTKYIEKAVAEKRCLILKEEETVQGFLLFDINFFECSFISLIIVSKAARRKGYATALITYFESISPTKKIFSSTNQSNTNMQKVFTSTGYVQSGFVENLDDGDPEIIYFKLT
ncbi:GNAT family N-acetyltransferase [Viridibacillus sp. NPDC096237]|uniref:GNAT family N-acetyltransferase n=1 Tax=Viridibacillus sp. NPDC096237 TaxID=3390721 RepID=UPI003D0595C6